MNGNGTKGRQARLPADSWLARQVRAGRSLHRLQLQPEADRRALLQRGLGRQRAASKRSSPTNSISPRDYDGHGTHTATTAGGNAGVQATGPAAVFGKISGIAPRARIAAYKVCWATASRAAASAPTASRRSTRPSPTASTSSTSRSAARQTNFLDPVEVAFLFAADAGVFVAASAGNSGPTTSTVAHPSPWLTTVAAGTHNRDVLGSVTLGNGATYTGASFALHRAVARPTVWPAARPAGANVDARACASPRRMTPAPRYSIPPRSPARSSSASVACNARVNKSLAVRRRAASA